MKIAVAQLIASKIKEENLAKAQEYIKKAKDAGADLIVIPETFMAYIPANSSVKYAEVAEDLSGPFVSGLQEAAKENGIYVVCGMYESKSGEALRAYNTTVILDRNGNLIHSYRKTHLYDAFAYKESSNIIPGENELMAVDTEFGKLGVLVCYELRFPEISRQFVLQGADILLVPTAWVAGSMKEEHFETLVKARALENTVYICAADQVGNIYAGRSVVFDPMGVTVASLGEQEGLIVAEIDLKRIAEVRHKLPCLMHRRTELYKQ